MKSNRLARWSKTVALVRCGASEASALLRGAARIAGPCCLAALLAACGGGGGGAGGSTAAANTASSSSGGTSSSSGAASSSSGSSSGSSSSSSSSSGSSSSSISSSSGSGTLIPAPPPVGVAYPICATQINVTGPGQSMGTVCGNNPNFPATWSSGVPSTCLGIPQCTSELGGVTYDVPIFLTFKITSGFATPLTAQIINCQPNVGKPGTTCIPSNDSPSTPMSHSVTWGAPNGNAGPLTTLILQQIGSSEASSLCNVPPAQWPGNYVLITDTYGNADIFFFGGVGTETCGPGQG